jgi:hypothetical protein
VALGTYLFYLLTRWVGNSDKIIQDGKRQLTVFRAGGGGPEIISSLRMFYVSCGQWYYTRLITQRSRVRFRPDNRRAHGNNSLNYFLDVYGI